MTSGPYRRRTTLDVCSTRVREACETDTDMKHQLEDAMLEAGLKEVTIMYPLDRQALEEQLVTMLWLDCHGERVW
jgi:hypothetical protein